MNSRTVRDSRPIESRDSGTDLAGFFSRKVGISAYDFSQYRDRGNRTEPNKIPLFEKTASNLKQEPPTHFKNDCYEVDIFEAKNSKNICVSNKKGHLFEICNLDVFFYHTLTPRMTQQNKAQAVARPVSGRFNLRNVRAL